jgi:alkylation response protein AidB-like acyl-CoA dehydrogenase
MDHPASPRSSSALLESDIVAAVSNLIPLVRAAHEECERSRRVPAPLVEALAAANLLQMYLPRAMGGPELPPLVVFRAVEEISRADGSIGWCTMIATGVSNSIGLLEAEVGRKMAGCPACGLRDRFAQWVARGLSMAAIASKAVGISRVVSTMRAG